MTNDGGRPGGVILASDAGGLNAECREGDQIIADSVIVRDPSGIVTSGPTIQDRPDYNDQASLWFVNDTGEPTTLSITATCEDLTP